LFIQETPSFQDSLFQRLRFVKAWHHDG
jgi:hypothetical protein